MSLRQATGADGAQHVFPKFARHTWNAASGGPEAALLFGLIFGLFGVHPEVVDFGSGEGRSDLETGGVAGLRRGFPKSENAGRGRKMPAMDGY